MSKPTEQQIRKLENAHKIQYLDLVTANRLWLKLLSKLPKVNGVVDKTTRQYKALINYGNVVNRLAVSWYMRQRRFEQKAKVPAVNIKLVSYFLNPKLEPELIKQAQAYLAPGSKLNGWEAVAGIGIIPLIIWGIVLLVGAFTAVEIIDETTTTAEEKQELLVQTQKTLQELDIKGPEAAAIISQTQKQASEGGGGLFATLFGSPLLLLGFGAAAFFLIKNKNKSKANG